VWTSLVSLVRWHRRGLAAVLAGVVVFSTLSALTGRDSADLVAVVVATRLVAAGDTVTATDVALTRLPRDAIPDGALTEVALAVGKVAGTGVRARQVLTDLTLVGGTTSDGTVVLSVRLDNPELAALAPPGTRVSLYATTSAEAVATHVLVVAAPSGDGGSILSPSSATVLLVRVTTEQAGSITQAMAQSTLTLAIG